MTPHDDLDVRLRRLEEVLPLLEWKLDGVTNACEKTPGLLEALETARRQGDELLRRELEPRIAKLERARRDDQMVTRGKSLILTRSQKLGAVLLGSPILASAIATLYHALHR